MKRVGIAAVSLLFIAVLAGGAHRAWGGHPDVCDGFTPAKMLEDPEFAREYFGALHGDGTAARAHLDAIVSELRAVHGCGDAGDVAPALRDTPERSRALPPGHPPVGGTSPVLPDLGGSATKTWTI
jgi:hypothetical protein